MTKACERFWITILAVALSVDMAWAQQQKDPRVNPPVAPQAPLSTGESSNQVAQEGSGFPVPEEKSATPDTRSLSGAELFTLGQMGERRSYLLASVDFFQSADSNSDIAGNQTNFDAVSTFSGHIVLQRLWSRYQLALDYTGGGSVYNNRSGLNTPSHQFGLTQSIAWRRWSLKLSDYFGYLPESAFGFGGFNSGLGGPNPTAVNINPVSNAVNLNPILTPNQTIFTSRASRLSNTAVGEVGYEISRRSSITATGSYGILHFSSGTLINSNNAIFQTGYNYELTKRDTLALTYGFSRYWFGGTTRTINDHAVLVGYGRRLTGRLALQLSAGPEVYKVSDPVGGSGRRASWTTSSALRYRFRRSELEASYATYLAGGAGVLAGSRSHQVQATMARQLSRMWSGSLNLGFAHNTALPQDATQTGRLAFNTWYSGANLSRPLGRHTSLFLDYFFQRQVGNNASNAPCISGGICGTNLVRHHFGLGFNWHLRPIRID